MTKFRAALAIAAALILSACYAPTTTHPIGSSVAQRPDAALTGLWKGTDADGKPTYIHFLPRLDGTITAIIVQGGTKPDADWESVTLTTAKLGNSHFMNAVLLSSDGKPDTSSPGGTVPVLYRIDAHGLLTLSLMDETPTKAAIAAGKIKGTVGQGSMGDAMITADPAALDKFFQTPAALALFVKPFLTLHKVD